MVTAGITGLPMATQDRVLAEIASFDRFDELNDPFAEHGFGTVRVDGTLTCFKVDCYDRSLTRLSPDPADETVAQRVLTIMLAEEF